MRYWFGRARLAGVFTILPIGLILQIGGCAVNVTTHYESTPKTVHVSGYYRRDGTYVHSYYRRPPGAAQHDTPYEKAAQNKQFAGGFVSLIGGVAVVIVLARFFAMPDWDLLPELKYTSHLPPKPKSIVVSILTAHARASWLCCRCGRAIISHDTYWYNHRSSKYCVDCWDSLRREEAAEKPKWIAYEAALIQEAAEKSKRRHEQYKRFYGRMPDV
jgi:hypothetical protein